jgi:hypothetical protein
MKHLLSLPLFALLVAAPLACGGKVYLDLPGTGAEGGGGSGSGTGSGTGAVSSGSFSSSASGTVTTATATTGTGMGGDCDLLAMNYAAALFEAMKCNACIDFDGCINGPAFTDVCGCTVVASTGDPDLIALAKNSFESWTGAGCPFLDCDKPCLSGNFWSCQPGPNGTCDGFCTPN